MGNLQLDWSTAEVSGGKLSVSLSDKPDGEWAAVFERTALLLDRGTWPEIKLKKGTITVKDLEEGSEEKLRFFLESVVQEANAEQEPDEADEDASEEETESGAEEADQESDPDREMTDRFRAFASGDGDGDGDDGEKASDS